MSQCAVSFDGSEPINVAAGTLLTDAAVEAGVFIAQPCGGQGRCGRCAVQVIDGAVRRRSTMRLSAEDVDAGYALGCQTVIEGDTRVVVPEQETLERRLTSDRLVAEVKVPDGYDWRKDQSLQRVLLVIEPPTMDDQRDDWSRLEGAIIKATNLERVTTTLPVLREMGAVLRDDQWRATALLNIDLSDSTPRNAVLVSLMPGHVPESDPLWGICVDIGTTTVSVWLVNLITGQVVSQSAEYNRQASRGEDVISRVIYSNKPSGRAELRELVLTSINTLIQRVCDKASRPQDNNGQANQRHNVHCSPRDIVKATIAGNSIMTHLLLGIGAESIRQSPFVTALNQPPMLSGSEVGLDICPQAPVDCLPGVASYVGSDITAGVRSSGLGEAEPLSLFLDIGTNGELVLGGKEWLVTCACSAGPAFEGGGVRDGMRATQGAVEEVWIDGRTFEPTLRVIGNRKPRGLCGSGLITLLAELFLTGIIDKGGHFNRNLKTDRVRQRNNNWEYVVAWGNESWHGEDIAITRVDIDNLIRAKAALYAGITVLAESVGLALPDIEQVLIGGAFGKYINVEKAVQIGLLPDMPWEEFQFLGNTAILGAYYALLRRSDRQRIAEIASRMTYIELSADNAFYEAFTSALFLPHTDIALFPSVAGQMETLFKQPNS
ncbi:MAG: ASKHA domain-containing protein [Candidatus Promineifilaceae bacterium]